jgi:hypothetical protein
MLLGCRLDAYPASYSDPAHVLLQILGGDGRLWLTPTEARSLAEHLKLAADDAEKP